MSSIVTLRFNNIEKNRIKLSIRGQVVQISESFEERVGKYERQ